MRVYSLHFYSVDNYADDTATSLVGADYTAPDFDKTMEAVVGTVRHEKLAVAVVDWRPKKVELCAIIVEDRLARVNIKNTKSIRDSNTTETHHRLRIERRL